MNGSTFGTSTMTPRRQEGGIDRTARAKDCRQECVVDSCFCMASTRETRSAATYPPDISAISSATREESSSLMSIPTNSERRSVDRSCFENVTCISCSNRPPRLKDGSMSWERLLVPMKQQKASDLLLYSKAAHKLDLIDNCFLSLISGLPRASTCLNQ